MKYFIIIVFYVLSFSNAISAPIERPKIQPKEYVVFFKEKYHVFKVVKFGELKLSSNCFSHQNGKMKTNKVKPKCQAYDVAMIQVNDLSKAKNGGTNPASLHCSRMMGESLIAYDYSNNEYDYCRFPDDSLVSSWSMLDNSYKRSRK